MSLDSFEIIKSLGEGAYSTVSLVKRKDDGQMYALKKVKLGPLKPKEKRNALTEVRILASIAHPNVISYKEAFIDEESESLCLVMEYADSGDLYQRICYYQKKGRYMSENFVWNVLIQLLRGLKVLHELDVLHRDLKSANVFLNKDGTVKLGDMNVSKVAKQGLLYTQTGTPYYASPEVWKDKPYDYKSDMWSLGCVVYEAATLNPPFKAEDMNGLFQKVIKGEYPPIPRMFSKELSKVIGQLLQVEPSARPSCEQLLKSSIIKKHSGKYEESPEESQENSLIDAIKVSDNIKIISSSLPKPNYGDNRSEPTPERPSKKSTWKINSFSHRSIKNEEKRSPSKISIEVLKESYGALKLPKIKYPVKTKMNPVKIRNSKGNIFSTRSLPLQYAVQMERLQRIKEVYLARSVPVSLSPVRRAAPIKPPSKAQLWT
ncbi:unnamed protein product [Blepharisma stoltei]|uniref:non-specific serine/threonine protein kinase n=1 Tax=Blepharisma stoltei TaxID=1481888 RepID=A0AAU9I8Q7_9CILI|nr:unnamed protein product [Blepharisma stoltei]